MTSCSSTNLVEVSIQGTAWGRGSLLSGMCHDQASHNAARSAGSGASAQACMHCIGDFTDARKPGDCTCHAVALHKKLTGTAAACAARCGAAGGGSLNGDGGDLLTDSLADSIGPLLATGGEGGRALGSGEGGGSSGEPKGEAGTLSG